MLSEDKSLALRNSLWRVFFFSVSSMFICVQGRDFKHNVKGFCSKTKCLEISLVFD